MSDTPLTLPIDGAYKEMQLPPAVVALAVTYDATISAATDITLNAATSYLEVSAIDKGVFLRWAATASSTAFDEFINAGETRSFVKPAGVTVISVIQESATAKVVIVEK